MRTVAFVPFEVPGARAPGLGVGLAGLIHSNLRAQGTAFVLARAFAGAESAEAADAPPGGSMGRELEGFVSPATWKAMSGRSSDLSQMRIDLLVTGRYEAPEEGSGQAELVAFEPATGRIAARAESLFSDDDAGAGLLRVVQDLATELGFDATELAPLDALGWEAFESTVRAEAALVGSPERTEDENQLAALVYYARALDDAPESAFLATRLAALAEHLFGQQDKTLIASARRALASVQSDSIELACSVAIGEAASGEPERASELLRLVVARAPTEPRGYALLARLARERGDVEGALAHLVTADERVNRDHPLLDNERGLVFLDAGRPEEAAAVLFTLLDVGLLARPGFLRLLALARSDGHAALAGRIVDRILADPTPSADALVQALELIACAEPPGLSRSQRVRALAMRALGHDQRRPELRVGIAHALLELDERALAQDELRTVLRQAPGSAPAALASELLLSIEEPDVTESIRAALRAAHQEDPSQLAQIAERARHFASKHDVWTAHLACAVAERRRERYDAARQAVLRGLASCPSCPQLLEERERLDELCDSPVQGTPTLSSHVKRMWSRIVSRREKD